MILLITYWTLYAKITIKIDYLYHTIIILSLSSDILGNH